jgi:putative holliday junction resolvase
LTARNSISCFLVSISVLEGLGTGFGGEAQGGLILLGALRVGFPGTRAKPAPHSTMRAAAVDLGTVRVGLAVADELGLLAHPRPYLAGKNPRAVVEALARLAEHEGITLFLVGLPRKLDGVEGPGARRARRFAERLRQRTQRKVLLVDERLSTHEARSRLLEQGLSERQARERIDSAAAAVLLQSWLDTHRQPVS